MLCSRLYSLSARALLSYIGNTARSLSSFVSSCIRTHVSPTKRKNKTHVQTQINKQFINRSSICIFVVWSALTVCACLRCLNTCQNTARSLSFLIPGCICAHYRQTENRNRLQKTQTFKLNLIMSTNNDNYHLVLTFGDTIVRDRYLPIVCTRRSNSCPHHTL